MFGVQLLGAEHVGRVGFDGRVLPLAANRDLPPVPFVIPFNKNPDFNSIQMQLAVKILPSIDFFGVKWTEVAQIRIVKVPFPNPVVQNLERRKDFRVINPPTQLRIRKLRELPGMRAFPGESRNPEKCHVIANNSKNPDPFRYSVTVNVNPV